jgi:hypothetical protein
LNPKREYGAIFVARLTRILQDITNESIEFKFEVANNKLYQEHEF